MSIAKYVLQMAGCVLAGAVAAAPQAMKSETLAGSGLDGMATIPAAGKGNMGSVQGSGHALTGLQQPTAGPTAPQQSEVSAVELQVHMGSLAVLTVETLPYGH